MDENTLQPMTEASNRDKETVSAATKRPWQDPKLVFVEPALTKHGELTEVTGQFFSAFSPTTS